MTLGEKIAKQRKNINYTQEQLASVLGVSRQSISKWESDIAYPETDKLIKLGKLFGCSMDYLLNDEVSEPDSDSSSNSGSSDSNNNNTNNSAQPGAFASVRLSGFRFKDIKSSRTVMGMPLYHIGKNAKGFIAIGLNAKGVFSIGLLSRGIVSLGFLSLGVFSFGFLSAGLAAFGLFVLGLLAFGCIALGAVAGGAVSIGLVSFGAVSIGCFAAGALAIGKYIAIGDEARAMIALGLTRATGSVYEHIGKVSDADLAFVAEWLDSSVGFWLSWAKELFKAIFSIG